MIAAGVAAGITPVVRVAELHYSLVARLLDVGAQGIIFLVAFASNSLQV